MIIDIHFCSRYSLPTKAGKKQLISSMIIAGRALMRTWERFFNEKIVSIFQTRRNIMDIGGGLRMCPERGNRFEKSRLWLTRYLDTVEYRIIDIVPDYNPHIVGDIHKLPLKKESVDAFICIAVLEHVENPFTAFEQMYDALVPGGCCLIYVPFLYSYHAQPGYYGDFWRYTDDGIRHLSKKFASVEIQKVRGALETLLYLSPFRKISVLNTAAGFFDRVLGKQNSRQTSGHYIYLVK